MRGNRDLELTVRAALLSAVLAIAIPVPVLSFIAAAPLLFFLPGYAIVCVAFARNGIEPARLLVLSVGLSLAILALLPLLLDLLPGGISTGWWAIGLLLVVLATARGAALARPRPARAAFPHLRTRIARADSALLIAGFLAAVVAVTLVFIPLPADRAVGYSELWIQPVSDRALSTVEVGLASREQEEVNYLLELRVSGREKPFAVEQVTLRPGEEESTVVPVPEALRQDVRKVSATLFKFGISDPYRRVATWTREPSA